MFSFHYPIVILYFYSHSTFFLYLFCEFRFLLKLSFSYLPLHILPIILLMNRWIDFAILQMINRTNYWKCRTFKRFLIFLLSRKYNRVHVYITTYFSCAVYNPGFFTNCTVFMICFVQSYHALFFANWSWSEIENSS